MEGAVNKVHRELVQWLRERGVQWSIVDAAKHKRLMIDGHTVAVLSVGNGRSRDNKGVKKAVERYLAGA